MEFLTILLSALIGIISPAGLIVDTVAENAIRDQLDSVETLAVRVDNAPSYQLLQGRVDRVRIAGRGIFPQPGIRIAAFELETEAIAIDPRSLREGEPELEQPVYAGVRLVLTEADLNRALQAPIAVALLQDLGSLVDPSAEVQRYDIVNPQIEFLAEDRLRFQVTLQERETDEQLAIVLESGLAIVSGQQIQFVTPSLIVNGEATSPRLIEGFATGISRQFDLNNVQDGITARILKLEIDPDQLQLAAFVRVEPEAIGDSEE